MPEATTSRRRLARRQNSDDIEDARIYQPNGNNDDVSDEERPVARRGQNGIVKKEKKYRPSEDDDANNAIEGNDDDDDRIDVANFADQSLRKEDLHKLKGISQDWEAMAQQIGKKCDIYRDVAVAMAEAGEKDTSSSKDLQALDRDMKDFMDVCNEMSLHAQALDAIYQTVARGEDVISPQKLYETGLKERMDEYAGKTSRQKYARDNRYIDFQTGIWEVHHPNDPMPPATEMIPREDGDDSDDDEELEMGGVTQTYTCPLTLTPLVNPVTSSVCQHSFSKDAITEYFRNPRVAMKCPTSGCNKSFRLTDCLPNPDLVKKVKIYQRRVARADENSDAEEVID